VDTKDRKKILATVLLGPFRFGVWKLPDANGGMRFAFPPYGAGRHDGFSLNLLPARDGYIALEFQVLTQLGRKADGLEQAAHP
jgi:hypothetical protein